MNGHEPIPGKVAYRRPCKQYPVSPELESALMAIEIRLCLRMARWDSTYPSPFANTGNKFHCNTFMVEAYSWDEEAAQPWNFKYRDVEVRWYKYLGSDMSVNRDLSTREIEEMLDRCYLAIQMYEAKRK